MRLISYALAVLLTSLTVAFGSYRLAEQNRTQLEYWYQRALSELNEYLSNLDITLEKGLYSSSADHQQQLAAELCLQTSGAMACLEQLPLSGEQTASLQKYLVQVGNYALSLAENASYSEKDYTTLETLSRYAGELSDSVTDMLAGLSCGEWSLTEENDTPAIGGHFEKTETLLSDCPSLIYDGPFSDHLLTRQPADNTAQPVSVERARQSAIAQTGNTQLQHVGESGGNVPCYVFSADNMTVSVTKRGGYVRYFLNARPLSEATLDIKAALSAAEKAMVERGYRSFVHRYHQLSGGVLTVNFVPVQDGVVLYPDLIKIGIAMDNGDVVSLEATNYIMNHVARELPVAAVKRSEARASLSPYLTPQDDGRPVLIPDDAEREILCYEFVCQSRTERTVLVYINALTGEEQEILLLCEDESGVLTM